MPDGVRTHHGNFYCSLLGGVVYIIVVQGPCFWNSRNIHYIGKKPFGQCSGSQQQIKRPVPRLCWEKKKKDIDVTPSIQAQVHIIIICADH